MEKFLNELRDLSISLSRNKDQIDIYDPEENLNADIIEKIKARKKDLLIYLNKLETEDDYEPLKLTGQKDSYPLSPAQKRLYFLYELNPDSLAYNMLQVYRVKGNLNKERVDSTFRKIITRHDSLRTNFEVRNGVPVQVINEAADFKLAYFEATEGDIDKVLNTFIVPFNLSNDCLIKVGLIHLSEEENILIFDMHHIIGDGISSMILVNDFKTLYRGEKLPPLKLQFKDYIAWQIEAENEDARKKDKEFWLKTFEDIKVSELPLDFKRPKIKSNGGEILPFELNTQETRCLKEIAQENGATLFVSVFTIFNIFLYKLTNQPDIVIGIPTLGRNHVDLEEIIGMFVNTLPIRNKLDENLSFIETLSAISKVTFNCFDHQSYPYDELVEALKLKRSPNRTPLFDVSFTYNNFESSGTDIVGLEFEDYEKKTEYSKLDLSLTATETGERLDLLFEYDTNLFRNTTLERFRIYFNSIVKQVVENKNIKISQIDIMPKEEKNLILYEFNRDYVGLPKEISILDLFTYQVQTNPNDIAIRFEENNCTYEKLEKQSNQLANYLIKKGVVREQLIPIYLERSIEMIVGILGVLKSGAAYVPIDSSLPRKRIDYMLADIEADLILTQSTLNNSIKSATNTIVLDEFFSEKDEYLSTPPNIKTKSNDLCYVIFTSGTTGNPKGVMIEHRSLTNLVVNQIELFGLTKSDKILQFASFSFDAFVSEMFTSLISGAELVIAAKEVVNSIEGINRIIQNQQITCITLPPSYQSFLNLDIHNLRIVISAGEPLNTKLTDTFQMKGVKVLNAYGPTENTVCTTLANNPIQNGCVSIGKPLKGVKVYILDRNKKLSTIGCIGELCVAGIQVSRGYLNRDELTREKFIENPYGDGIFERLYKTGDLARWTPEGNIEFLGRVDNQVKIRGYRIELDEIQCALNNIPSIEESVVIPSENNLALHAYYKVKQKVELWPSIAEFFIYDDLVYKSMYTHLSRNKKYKKALEKVIKGKVVLEIGTGPEAILSRLCIECGAKRVYSVEILEETYLKAKKRIEIERLTDKIELVLGDITKVEIPEDIDYCVSEIVGSIGGSEGAAVLIDHVKKFMKNPQNMIPSKSITKVAAISLEESMFKYGFSEVAYSYVEKILKKFGKEFEFRICLKNLPKENIISNNEIFEELDFTKELNMEYSHAVKLIFHQKSIFNGFYIWMELHLDNEIHLDILEDSDSWLPIFFPISYPGYDVQENDYLDIEIIRKFSSNNINPDYFVRGTLHRKNQSSVKIEFNSYHHEYFNSHNSFYIKLFEKGSQITLPTLDAPFLRRSLAHFLPDYMIPSSFTAIEMIPLTINGKVNKKELQQHKNPLKSNEEIDEHSEVKQNSFIAHHVNTQLYQIEKKLVAIWAELLEMDEILIDRNSDFFELGGHSLLAIDLTSRIKKIFSKEIPLAEIFEVTTIKDLSEKINEQSLFQIEGEPAVFLMKQGYDEENNLFIIHDGSGHISAYVELIKGIEGYNCYGINYRVPGFGPQNTSIEEFANNYIKKIQRIQKQGPYNLAGWSLGGVVLYEIARQLHRSGEIPDNLIIIDSKLDLIPKNTKFFFDVEGEKKVINSILGEKKLQIDKEETIESLWSEFVKSNAFEQIGYSGDADPLFWPC